MTLPQLPPIITERPEDMDYMQYRQLRKISNFVLRRRIRQGFLAWDSSKQGTFKGETKDL